MIIIVIILKKCAQNRDETEVAVRAKRPRPNVSETHVENVIYRRRKREGKPGISSLVLNKKKMGSNLTFPLAAH